MTGQTEQPFQEEKSIDLYPLPEGWKWVTVSDAGAHQRNAIVDGPFGSNLKVSDYVEGGPVPVLTTKNLEGKYDDVRYITKEKFEELKRSAVYPGDILMAKIGSCGKTGIYPPNNPPAMIPANLLKVSLNNQFELKYVYYYFNSSFFQKAIRTITKATAQPAFGVTNFRKLPLPYTTRDQQQLIVAEIEKQFSRLDEAVASLKRVKANLKRYKASVLKAAVEGKFASSDPSGWTRTNLGAVLTTIEAGKSFKCEERLPNIREIGVVKVSAVTWGTFNEEESKTCLTPDRIETRYFVKSGDFLFSRANTIQLVGRCVIAQKVTRKVMLSDKILRFHFSDVVVPHWVLYWLRSDIGRKEIQRLSTGNQESMRNIGQERIRQIAFALPSLDEQRAIVAEVERRLSFIEELEAVVEDNLKRADRLRQSILCRAFRGEFF